MILNTPQIDVAAKPRRAGKAPGVRVRSFAGQAGADITCDMPSHLILAMVLTSSAPGAATLLSIADRTVPVQVDCIGKRRVIAGPARAKRVEPRRRCHVIVPILM